MPANSEEIRPDARRRARRTRRGPCRRGAALAPAARPARPGRPRGARPPLPPLRQKPGPALPRRQRVLRRPAAGGEPRPGQRGRPLRPDPRHPLRRLRLPHHPRRTEAPLPRPGLDRAGAARAARPDGRSGESDRGADDRAAALALGLRDRGQTGDRAGRSARGAGGQPQPPAALARPPGGRRRRRIARLGVGRRRGRGLRADRRQTGARGGAAAARRPRTADPAAALRRGHDPVPDRRPDRPLADARLAHPPPHPGADPRTGRRTGRAR